MRGAWRRGAGRFGRALAAGLLGAAAILLLAPAASAQTPSLPSPGISPPGANDFDCEPPARHPYPVVLVHGTIGDMTYSWNLLSRALTRLGYCTFALDYGNRALGPIEVSAQQVEDFIDRVLEATGASKVAIVGHSQGGMLPRYLIKFLDGAEKVDEVVGLVPSNHGTTVPLAPLVGELGCPACSQQVAGSEFMQALNAGDETPGPVDYTQVTTRYDQIVTPPHLRLPPRRRRRAGHQRPGAGQVPPRPLRAHHLRQRSGRPAVGTERAWARWAGRSGLPAGVPGPAFAQVP